MQHFRWGLREWACNLELQRYKFSSNNQTEMKKINTLLLEKVWRNTFPPNTVGIRVHYYFWKVIQLSPIRI